MKYLVTPEGALRGEVQVAPDKSISHRAIIFSAIASGLTRVQNLLQGEDVLATIQAFRQMGVSIEKVGESEFGESNFEVQGVGLHGLSQPSKTLDMGNSGTAFRLLVGLMCGQRWQSALTGDESLCARPMGRIIKPLTQMGARIRATDQMPPLTISPSPSLCDPSLHAPSLHGISYHMPIASAQVKSSLLLAGLYAVGTTSVVEPAPTRDHTERMLARFGYPVIIEKNKVSLQGGGELHPCEIRVPADLSSAAFFLVGASIIPGSDVLLRNVGINPSRNGVLSILERMGARIELVDVATVGGEPVADIRVRSGPLRGCRIGGSDIALAIDEIPAIAVAAAFSRGTTEIRDAAELRVKESDRISSVVLGLNALGVSVNEHADGLTIIGGPVSGGQVDSQGDHRIAMAFTMAGGAAQGQVEILNCENVATSFPNFQDVANGAGLVISAA